jgi:hypothetical protein
MRRIAFRQLLLPIRVSLVFRIMSETETDRLSSDGVALQLTTAPETVVVQTHQQTQASLSLPMESAALLLAQDLPLATAAASMAGVEAHRVTAALAAMRVQDNAPKQ